MKNKISFPTGIKFSLTQEDGDFVAVFKRRKVIAKVCLAEESIILGEEIKIDTILKMLFKEYETKNTHGKRRG